jgi:hypothetical protein
MAELTYGQKAVGLGFNPSGDGMVDGLKMDYADIIDALDAVREVAKQSGDAEKIRLCSIAITEAQAAQMWAVKAATWQSS